MCKKKLARDCTMCSLSGMNLTRTQTAALLHFAGKTPRTIATNHQINGERACIKKGLIAREWVGLTEKRWLTPAGAEIVNHISK